MIGQSYYNHESQRRVVEVPITRTIEDAFVMVHEVLHDMNLKPNSNTADRMLYTETISMLGGGNLCLVKFYLRIFCVCIIYM